MALDPILVVEVREWMRRASNDLRAAEVDMRASPPLLEDALFHCQQAVEKAMKAFLTFHNQPFRRTHNLEEVGEACIALDGSLQSLVDDAVPLSEYAWAYRYPGPTDAPTPEEADEAYAIAQNVFTGIAVRLPPDVTL
jgi:HEPN domain-containing protein